MVFHPSTMWDIHLRQCRHIQRVHMQHNFFAIHSGIEYNELRINNNMFVCAFFVVVFAEAQAVQLQAKIGMASRRATMLPNTALMRWAARMQCRMAAVVLAAAVGAAVAPAAHAIDLAPAATVAAVSASIFYFLLLLPETAWIRLFARAMHTICIELMPGGFCAQTPRGSHKQMKFIASMHDEWE